MLGLDISNNSGTVHSDFDLKFKINAFAIHVEGAAKKI